MTTIAANAQVLPKGVNHGRTAQALIIVPSTSTSSDTLAVPKPDGLDPDMAPVSVSVARPVSSTSVTFPASPPTLTSFNPATGAVVLTPVTTLNAGDRVLVNYSAIL